MLLDPNIPVSDTVFNSAIQLGFRRSGDLVYRPHCGFCNACVSVRIPVADYKPNRSQKRTAKRNADLDIQFIRPDFYEQHFQLFCDYQAWKHTGDSMDHADRDRYQLSMVETTVNTALVEFTLDGQLLAVSVVDVVSDGLSAVYTFFDPDYSARSLGAYAILWQIETAKRLKLDNLYLGFWIKDCKKMSYKMQYQPLEYYSQGKWQKQVKK